MVITLLLLFPFVLVYVLICLPKDFFSARRMKRKHRRTLLVISNSGYIIGIGGAIGKGKTTSAAGITSFLEQSLIGDAWEKIDYVQTILNHYDFTNINRLIDSIYFDTKPESALEKVINESDISNILYDDDMHNYYDDGIKIRAYEDLLRDYIEARLALNRNNYVYSNIKYDSVVTGNRAFDLKGSDFKIKDRMLKKNYTLRRYAVFNYDEATLDPDKLNFNWQNAAKDDSGTIEHLRLFRHWYKGRSYYITTLQNPERLNKSERELFNSIYMIRDKYDYEEWLRVKKILRLVDTVNERLHNLKLKFRRLFRMKNIDDKKSRYKNIKRFCLQKLDKLNSKDYLVYEVEIYDTTKEAENNSRNKVSTKLVFPKKWCYGPIDTYEYSYQYDAAVAVSEVAPNPKANDATIEDKIILANKYLSKKVKEDSNKNKKPVIKKKKILIGGI